MGFLSKLFGNNNTKSKTDIFWETIKSFKNNHSTTAYNIMYEHIKLEVKGKESELERIFQKRDPKIFALSFVANICGDFCESGEFHLYRGVLNPTGSDFLEMFKDAVKESISLGDISQDWYDENLAALLDNISKVG